MRRFLAGSGPKADQLRSSMFKLVPSVEQGSWIIRQSVGNTPVLLGKKLKTEYHRYGMRPMYPSPDLHASELTGTGPKQVLSVLPLPACPHFSSTQHALLYDKADMHALTLRQGPWERV